MNTMSDATQSQVELLPVNGDGYILISPVLAADILAKGAPNRGLSGKLVERYAVDMAAGDWHDIGDPIRLSADGRLYDGQHRLAAIIRSGVTLRIRVQIIDPKCMLVIDTGRRRSLSDQLRIAGEQNAKELASALPYLHALINGGDFGTNAFRLNATDQQLLRVLENHPGLRLSTTPAKRLYDTTHIPTSFGTFRHYQFGLIDEDDRDDFWKRLISRDFWGSGDPLNALNEKAKANWADKHQKLDIITFHALLVKTWNLYRSGSEIKLLRWRRGGHAPEPFPQAL